MKRSNVRISRPARSRFSGPPKIRFPRPLRIVCYFLLAWVLLHLAYITYDGLQEYKGQADIAVVLGNRVYNDSTLSPVLQGRVDRALRLYKEGRVPRIMVSGGLGIGDDHVPEGMAMKKYLVAHGVPADAVIEDNAGANTWLTAKNFISLNDSLHCRNAIVVSSFSHITRCKYIFRHLGFRNVYSVSSDSFFAVDLIGLLREFPAFYKYLLTY